MKKEIDLTAIASNIKNIVNASENRPVIPVIKSDGYGLGAVKIAKYLKDITLFAVVNAQEAITLCENDITASILILNSITEVELKQIDKYPNIQLSINCINDCDILINANRIIHIQIETGMNRLGVRTVEECKKIIAILKKTNNSIEGLYTHFTSCDNYSNQVNIFKNYIPLYPFKYVHCAASSTYAMNTVGNYVRVGLDVYGSRSDNQSLTVTTKILAINEVKRNQTVGYSSMYKASKDERIAVLDAGYNDGLTRKLTGYTVLINDKLYKIVGNICMNHCFVVVDDTVKIDDVVVITSKKHPISKMAEYLETVDHEVLCMFKGEASSR